VQGLIKQIGDGQPTHIWTDNWLPQDFMMKPVASLIDNPPHMVSDLIDENFATWKEDLVCACFLPMDASIILGTPLSTRAQADF
jgi:hypothetical protein